MNRNFVRLILLISLVALPVHIIGLGASNELETSNNAPRIKINITDAYYTDLDEDNIEDDIVTKFRVQPPLFSFINALMYLEITLPSGITHNVTITHTALYFWMVVTVEWYNCATESGWYDFEVMFVAAGFDMFGNDLTTAHSTQVEFDPPEEGPPGGLPFCEVRFGI